MKYSYLEQLSYVKNTFHELGKKPWYIVFSICVALCIFGILILLPNYSFIQVTLVADYFSFSEKFKILLTSFGAFNTNFTVFSQVTTILISILFGVQSSLLLFYLKKSFALQKSMGISFFGMVLSVLGVGCTACGSVVLSSVFGISAVTGMLGLLPLRGIEITIIGFLILSWSIWYTALKYSTPITCSFKKVN